MKKKIAAVLVSALVVLSVFSGCTGGQESQTEETEVQEVSPQETEDQAAEEDTEPADVEVMALKGPTAMGMVKFMDDVDSGSVTSENYNFSIAASADEVTPKLVQGEADIAAVPANLASVLYNKTQGQVEVLAVNTLGVL